jgi:uncharacterized membrane protein
VNRTVVVTALVVWLLISFVPALSATNLLGMARGRRGGAGA